MNPTNQFVVEKLYDLKLLGLDISITNSSFAMIVTSLIIISFLLLSSRNLSLIPSKLQSTAEIFYNFIHSIVNQYAGHKALPYMPLIITIFLMIFIGSLLGLIPGFFTFTSQLIITLTFALITFLSVIIIGVRTSGLKFFKMFIHSNMPLPITLFIIPIEIISFLARPISLCLRLCINMIAGHMMLKIFASFIVALPVSSIILMPLLIVLTLFEILVAGIQAYIFTMLTCIYLSDSVNEHAH